jgi:hypothetical protein
MNSYRFDWGEAVRVAGAAENSLRPGQVGSVCGKREVDQNPIYLVEFSDGSAIEIPEIFLEPV